MWRPIATIAAAARDVELEEPVLKFCWYSIYINLVLNIFIFLGGGPTLRPYVEGSIQQLIGLFEPMSQMIGYLAAKFKKVRLAHMYH